MNATRPLKLQPHPDGAYLVDLRNELYELPRGMKALHWWRLLQQVTHCDNEECPMCSTARAYVIGHSPYKSPKTLRTAWLRRARKMARQEMWHLARPARSSFSIEQSRQCDRCGEYRWPVDEQDELIEMLFFARAYRLASEVGITRELHGEAGRYRSYDNRLAIAHVVLLERRHGIVEPVGHVGNVDGLSSGWKPDRLEWLPCCSEIGHRTLYAVGEVGSTTWTAVTSGQYQSHVRTAKHVAGLFAVKPRDLVDRGESRQAAGHYIEDINTTIARLRGELDP